jgi:hypothetical protein
MWIIWGITVGVSLVAFIVVASKWKYKFNISQNFSHRNK